jgi:hypothetical protein
MRTELMEKPHTSADPEHITRFKSFVRIAAVAALLVTAAIDASNYLSNWPPLELAAGIVSGIVFAVIIKAVKHN